MDTRTTSKATRSSKKNIMFPSASTHLMHISSKALEKGKFPANVMLEGGSIIKFGSETLKVMHTPGHTPGSICLVGEKLVFTGDTLFAGGIGRTDFPGGSMTT